MSMQCHFLDRAAFSAAQEARMALAKKRGQDQAWLKANNTDHGCIEDGDHPRRTPRPCSAVLRRLSHCALELSE